MHAYIYIKNFTLILFEYGLRLLKNTFCNTGKAMNTDGPRFAQKFLSKAVLVCFLC